MTDGGLAVGAGGWLAGWRGDLRTYGSASAIASISLGIPTAFGIFLLRHPYPRHRCRAPPLYEQRPQIVAMDSDSDLDLGSGGGMKPSPSELVCVGTREVTMGTADRSKAPVPSILACFRAKESANGGGDDTKASPSALTLMFTDGSRTYSGR